MRRESELFYKNKTIALIYDCVYFCWQNHQISDQEDTDIEKFLDYIDEHYCVIRVLKLLEATL